MASIPSAPLEGTDGDTSTEERPILFLTEDDSSGGLRYALLKALDSAVTNGQRLGAMAVGIEDGGSEAVGATTDAAVTTDATGSISAKLRGLVAHAVERQPPDSVTEYNVTLTSADTQYSQALPSNCKAVAFRCRTLYEVRFSWVRPA